MNQRGDTPMGTKMTIMLSKEERASIESYAARRGMSISEAIRQILERHVKEQMK